MSQPEPGYRAMRERRADPWRTDRQIAAVTGVSYSEAANVRHLLEASGDIPVLGRGDRSPASKRVHLALNHDERRTDTEIAALTGTSVNRVARVRRILEDTGKIRLMPKSLRTRSPGAGDRTNFRAESNRCCPT